MKIIIPLSIIYFSLLLSCNSNKKDQGTETNNSIPEKEIVEEIPFKPDTLKMYEGMPSEILKGARIHENIRKVKLYNFSSRESKDTFILEVPKGKIEYSNSKVTIVNSKGQVIYSLVFPTYFLRDGYDFIPDVPQGLDSTAERLFLERFDQNLTNEVYEKYFLQKIDDFLSDCVFRADKDDYLFDIENSRNKSVRNEILKNRNFNCVYFPIHYGDEGSSYIGYSKSNNRAYIFAETD